MLKYDIKSKELRQIINLSINAGGELKLIVEDALENTKTEKEFELACTLNLRNYVQNIAIFYNRLAKRNGYDVIDIYPFK